MLLADMQNHNLGDGGSGENQWELGDGSTTYLSTLPPILFVEVVI